MTLPSPPVVVSVGSSVLWPSPTPCQASRRLSASGLIPPLFRRRRFSRPAPRTPSGRGWLWLRSNPRIVLLRFIRNLAGSPQMLEGVFRACRRLLHRRASRVVPISDSRECQASPIEQGLAARSSMTLPAMSVMALFTMLMAVRLPTACSFASPLGLAWSYPKCWASRLATLSSRWPVELPRTTQDQAIGP